MSRKVVLPLSFLCMVLVAVMTMSCGGSSVRLAEEDAGWSLQRCGRLGDYDQRQRHVDFGPE